jgi:hypothetical protein
MNIALHSETFHAAFSRALFVPDGGIPVEINTTNRASANSRFDIYRNNVVAGLIKALADRYPVVRQILWDEAFTAVARDYVIASPPRSPVMLEYGEDFPDFLRSYGDCQARDYLADIAALESARVRAYHAAEAFPISKEKFASFDVELLAHMRLVLHPSVTLLRSRYPVVTAWEMHRSDAAEFIRQWRPEAALIARPYFEVEVKRLSDGSYEFFKALADGGTLAAAMETAADMRTIFEPVTSLAQLIEAQIVVGFTA